MTGRLVLVATPIGNLGDMSPRAVEALAAAHHLACEDTRRTGRLLSHFAVRGPRLVVMNEHTEAQATQRLLARLADGDTVAVVTDAGTPGISDPGERLVAAAVAAGVEIVVIPGPVAATTALVGSGLPTDRFVMEGFLPRSGGERTARLAEVVAERRTTVLYEAPHRLVRTLDDLVAAGAGSRPLAVARELTKLHEQWWRGSVAEAAAHWSEHEPRGEFVLVLGGAPAPPPPAPDDLDEALRTALAGGAGPREAAESVAARLGTRRQATYRRAMELADARDT